MKEEPISQLITPRTDRDTRRAHTPSHSNRRQLIALDGPISPLPSRLLGYCLLIALSSWDASHSGTRTFYELLSLLNPIIPSSLPYTPHFSPPRPDPMVCSRGSSSSSSLLARHRRPHRLERIQLLISSFIHIRARITLPCVTTELVYRKSI